MYLFKNDVFVKTTFIYLMGLLFPNATFIYFFRLLHSTFISIYITPPHLLPLHIYYPSTFISDLTCKREGHGYLQTNACCTRSKADRDIYLYHQNRHKFTQHSTLLTIFKSHLIFAAVGSWM